MIQPKRLVNKSSWKTYSKIQKSWLFWSSESSTAIVQKLNRHKTHLLTNIFPQTRAMTTIHTWQLMLWGIAIKSPSMPNLMLILSRLTLKMLRWVFHIFFQCHVTQGMHSSQSICWQDLTSNTRESTKQGQCDQAALAPSCRNPRTGDMCWRHGRFPSNRMCNPCSPCIAPDSEASQAKSWLYWDILRYTQRWRAYRCWWLTFWNPQHTTNSSQSEGSICSASDSKWIPAAPFRSCRDGQANWPGAISDSGQGGFEGVQ